MSFISPKIWALRNILIFPFSSPAGSSEIKLDLQLPKFNILSELILLPARAQTNLISFPFLQGQVGRLSQWPLFYFVLEFKDVLVYLEPKKIKTYFMCSYFFLHNLHNVT